MKTIFLYVLQFLGLVPEQNIIRRTTSRDCIAAEDHKCEGYRLIKESIENGMPTSHLSKADFHFYNRIKHQDGFVISGQTCIMVTETIAKKETIEWYSSEMFDICQRCGIIEF